MPVRACNASRVQALAGGAELANISIRGGAVARFALASDGGSFTFGECVTSPDAALGGLGPGGARYAAEVFPAGQAVVSNNVWRSVTVRRATAHGVLAEQWADTERWYDLYVMLAADGATAISLGAPGAFSKIDRFMFISPCIVYDPGVDPATVHGIVLNPGVFRINLQDVHSDKLWPSGHVEDRSGRLGSYDSLYN